MSFRIIDKGKLACRVYVEPGDRMELRWRDPRKLFNKERLVAMAEVDVAASYGDYVIFEATDEIGAKDGLGGMFCNLDNEPLD
jgi:hypothetical protein